MNAFRKAPRVPPSPNSLAAAFDRRALIGAAVLAPIAAAACVTEPVHAQPGLTEWELAMAFYLAKRVHSDMIPLGTPGEDEALDAYCEAMDYLVLKIPSPDGKALAAKLRLAKERWADLIMPDAWLDTFIADAERLSHSMEG